MTMDKACIKDEQMDQVTGGTIIPYSVQPGDSFASIASKFHVTEEKLKQWNNIPEGVMLITGQILKIKF